MTDTTHWAPSDAMAALERGHDARAVMEVAYGRTCACFSRFEYVAGERWRTVATAAYEKAKAGTCWYDERMEAGTCWPPNPWVTKEEGEAMEREFVGTWDRRPDAIERELLKPDRPAGLNTGIRGFDEEIAHTWPGRSGRRGGKTAAGRAWAEANGATVLGRARDSR